MENTREGLWLQTALSGFIIAICYYYRQHLLWFIYGESLPILTESAILTLKLSQELS